VSLFFWDASALVKRYTVEIGTETVNAMFADLPRHDMATTPWGYAETYSILLRRLNGGTLDRESFAAAVTALQVETIESSDFGFLTISDVDVFASISTMRKHNLNATDAAILTVLLRYARSTGDADCVLAAADKRLLRAADEEALITINPEHVPAEDVSAFLAVLSRTE
jgi:predicted nucleic acid-binding protein